MTGRRWVPAALAAAVAGCVAIAGCANSNAAITQSGAKALKPYLVRVRAAAHDESLATLQSAVTQLQAATARENAAGDLTRQREVEIDNAADALLTDLTAKLSTPSPTPSPTTPSPTPTETTPSPTTSPTSTPTSTSPSPSPSESSSSLLPGPPGHQPSHGHGNGAGGDQGG
ncbi:MAG TPA: hypothetical protein VG708_15735 [Mycobacteriales bacterium]|nr:hypothetical protein [Mycobacteriales bacterium]